MANTAKPASEDLRLVALRLTLGVCFFLLGIVGSLLPVLQGWLFFLLAAVMFFPRSRIVERVMHKADRRTPRIARALRKLGIGD